MVVSVQDLAKQVAIAEVMFQIQHSLLEEEILVEPPVSKDVCHCATRYYVRDFSRGV